MESQSLTILSQHTERNHFELGIQAYFTACSASLDAAALLIFPQISALAPSPVTAAPCYAPAAVIGCRGAAGRSLAPTGGPDTRGQPNQAELLSDLEFLKDETTHYL